MSNCTGDGITVYGATNTYIHNVLLENNTRQGISIIRCNGLIIDKGIIKDTSGGDPACGIDIEPNVNTDEIIGLKIIDIETKNNDLYGILTVLDNLKDRVQKIEIEIINHKDSGSVSGFTHAGLRPSVQLSGYIKNINPNYTDNSIGIQILDHQATLTPTVTIDNPRIFNPIPLPAQPTIPRYGGTGILINREVTYTGTLSMGNIDIINPYIEDNNTSPVILRGIDIEDQKGLNFVNVNIINPFKISGVVSSSHKIAVGTSRTGVKVIDDYKICSIDTTTQYTSLYNNSTTYFTNVGATVKSQIDLAISRFIDESITFVNQTAYGIIIVPTSLVAILPMGTAGKYITTTQLGASVTLRKINGNYYVANIVGTWTVAP